ncbi:MAG: PLD nuclease N-terminal domain-containing protein [Rubricoccaceae bacterium]|nr:PLD nuclease N-terminal domain-containing protein [Rubricoccaceae bacterium]
MRSPRRLSPGVLAGLLLGVLVTLSGCANGNFGELVTGRNLGCCGLLIVLLDIYAFIQIAQSHADGVSKVLWALLVFFFPVGGFLLWYFFGPRR